MKFHSSFVVHYLLDHTASLITKCKLEKGLNNIIDRVLTVSQLKKKLKNRKSKKNGKQVHHQKIFQ